MEAVGGVEVRRVALSDADGERQFNFHPQRPATSSLLAEPRPDQTVESRLVPVTTIDAEWDRAGRPELDCIKVDTQGEDLRVLAGAERTLAEQAPLLIVEAIFVPLYSNQAERCPRRSAGSWRLAFAPLTPLGQEAVQSGRQHDHDRDPVEHPHQPVHGVGQQNGHLGQYCERVRRADQLWRVGRVGVEG